MKFFFALSACVALAVAASLPVLAASQPTGDSTAFATSQWAFAPAGKKCATWIGPGGATGYRCASGTHRCKVNRNAQGWGIGCADSGGTSIGIPPVILPVPAN